MSITTPEKYRREVNYTPEGESMTEQSHVESCDIHNILKKYERTGILEHVNANKAFYGDVSNVPDFKQAQNTVIAITAVFNTLPAKYRDQLDNDPQKFLDFVTDPANKQTLAELGMPNDHLEGNVDTSVGIPVAPGTPPAVPPFEVPTAPVTEDKT